MADMTPEEIRQVGLAALQRELGVVGAVRFLQHFGVYGGDYTAERHQWLPKDQSIEDLAKEANRIAAASNLPEAD